jgi:methylthioribose-1-phosphate isomerase
MTSVEWVAGKVRFIDQTRLPAEEVTVETSDYRVVAEAIRTLQIRGAPAIGVAAAFGVLLAVDDKQVASPEDLGKKLYEAINYLSQTRPTAVNLFGALNRMRRAYEQARNSARVSIWSHLELEARAIQQEDIEACHKIGELGAELIQQGSSVLTHCNTGALATAGDGTAQSIITTAARQKKILRVFVDETRPHFQGARLTSWELMKQGLDVVLITDSTAGFLMQQREVNAVIVGADRIAANGDVANKIGTYPLAVLAERHMVPFYVAAPTSTIDVSTKTGKQIPVEERKAHEVTHVNGVSIAPEGVKVFAPVFDITPNGLVTAIVTEGGILKPPFVESIAGLRRQPTQAVENET